MDGMSTRMEASAGKLSDVWDGALSRQERAGEKLAGDNQQALAAAAALERQSAALVQAVSQSHADLQAALMARDEQRLAAWNASLGSVSASLRQEWEQAAAQTAGRQQEICDALALTAQRISDHTQLQAGETIAEISRLVQAAADAPGRRRAAGRAGRARPGSPAGLDGHAGEHDRRAAPGMAAGAEAASRQREICDALSLAAQTISEQAHPGQRHAGRDQPAGRRRRRRAQGRPRVAGRTGRARPRAPGRLERLAGRDDRRAAPGMQQAGADAANRQREICDALALAAQRISEQTQAQASGTLAEINRLVDAAADAPPALALQGELARARDRERLDAWSGSLAEIAALRQEWQQAGADAASRQRADALLAAKSTRLVDAAAEAPSRRRPAGRAGGPRPGPPGRVDRHAGRDGRNAAPGMAAGRRRCRQPPAADLRGAGRHRPPDLGSIARPRQRHAGRDQPPVDAAAEAPRPPSPCKATWSPRRGPPGRLDRIAGRHGRRAARGMAADRRRHRQPPAGNLRRAGPGRARHLRAHPHPRQRHHRRDRAPGAGRVRGARAPPPRSSANCVRSCPTAWPTTTPCWKSAAACSTRSRPCWTPSTSPPPSNAPPWTRWSAPPRN